MLVTVIANDVIRWIKLFNSDISKLVSGGLSLVTRVAGVKRSSASVVCLSVCSLDIIKMVKLQSLCDRDSPSWVLAIHLIHVLCQKSKGQGTGSQSVKTYFRRSSGRREFALYLASAQYLFLLYAVLNCVFWYLAYYE